MCNAEERAIKNQRSLDRLAKTIVLSQGRFSLILARADRPQLQRDIVARLREKVDLEIDEIDLSANSQTLYSTILEQLNQRSEARSPQAVMVFGLDGIIDLERVLKSANFVRNEFPQHCPYPLCLWMAEDTSHKLQRLAPDLRNWAANPLKFYETDET